MYLNTGIPCLNSESRIRVECKNGPFLDQNHGAICFFGYFIFHFTE